MSGEDTDKRSDAPSPKERPDTSDVGGIDLSAYNIDVSEPFGFDTGNDDTSRVDRVFNDEGLAISTNPIGPGKGDQRVKDLQILMINELDPEGRKDQPSTVLPEYGVDGVWRCETQTAFNQLLAQKGIEPCEVSPGSPSQNCGGVNTPSCMLTEETLDKLKEAKSKEGDSSEEPCDEEEEKPNFDDQCFLISNIKEVFLKSKPTTPGASFHDEGDMAFQLPDRTKIKYKNIHKLATTDPATIMNRLRLTKGCTEFLGIRHFQLSQLTPTIRLYKQYYEGPKKTPREVEFEFSSYVDPVKDLQSMLDSSLQRGVGIGIENFTFDFQGIQPATTKKDIVANLTIHAQNFNELFKFRQGVDQNGSPLEGGYRIIDLVLLEPKYRFINDEQTDQKIREFNPQFYEIKVRAGWASTGGGGLMSDDLTSAIKDNQVEMFLVVTGHEFDFRDDGSVKLKLEFRARVESLLLDKRSDVLFDAATLAKRDERRNKLNEIALAKSQLGSQKVKCEDDTIKQLRKIYEETVEIEREDSYLSILRQLLLEGCVYTAVLKIPDEEDKQYAMLDGDPPPEMEFTVENYSCEDETLLTKPNILEPGVRRVNFFYLGDLYALGVNNVLEKVEDSSTDLRKINYGNIKFVLGPAPFEDPNIEHEGNVLSLNIADIPISVDLFTDFMREKVIKGRRNTYPLLVFMRDAMRDLVFEALGPECGSGDQRISLLLDSAQISADSTAGGGDPIAEKIGELIELDLDEYGKNLPVPTVDSAGLFGRKNKKLQASTKFVFDSFNKKSLDRSYEYFIVYAFGKEPRRLAFESGGDFASRYERDLSNGIFHTTTGLDRGLVKKIQFQRTDQPYLAELRYEQSDFKPELQLSNVYNTTIEMYGNNLFFPGCQVYVNPRGLGSELLGDPGVKGSKANIMGLGGYHVVKKVRHAIGPSGYTTTLDCLFTTSGDGLGSIMTRQARVGDTVLLECADLEKEIDRLASSMGGKIKRSLNSEGGGT
jgi:hypothetical protein